MQLISANIIDPVARRQFYGEVEIQAGRIRTVYNRGMVRGSKPFLVPGLVDAHVHIESSLLIPDEFARAALRHGVVGSVSDPHEIANVLGVEGIRYMRRRASMTPFRILFGAPSCVPATPFESSGAELGVEAIRELLETGEAGYLSEVMNYPGVISREPEIMAKIAVARRLGVPIDGHAPGLVGQQAVAYAGAGISTDHECTTLSEARDKLDAGMLILLREGSAARDFDALHSLIGTDTDRVMLCSDDKHPDELLEGYIDRLVVRAIRNGQDVFDVLRVAAVNPVRHYGLPLGLLQPGDSFDAVQIDNVGDFRVDKVWLAGRRVVNDGICLLPRQPVDRPNAFHAEPVHARQLSIPHPGSPCRVIVASDGRVVTRQKRCPVPERDGCIAADPDGDVLFLAVVNRYRPAPPALALVQGFGITGSDGRGGAIASSVAHDSHNVVAVGTSAEWLALAINAVIHERGGLAAVDADGKRLLPLPIAGLMSDGPAEEVALAYRRMNLKARAMGSRLSAPFMTLSFMSLLVIPELKLSDRGLFDGMRFEFCDLGVGNGEVPT